MAMLPTHNRCCFSSGRESRGICLYRPTCFSFSKQESRGAARSRSRLSLRRAPIADAAQKKELDRLTESSVDSQQADSEAESTEEDSLSTSDNTSQRDSGRAVSSEEASGSGRTVLLSLLGIAGVGAAAAGSSGFLGTGLDTSGPGSIVGALGVLATIIAVHETGHFVAARSRNIHVEQFSIGFGPAIWSYKGKIVEYSLRAFPLGGFVGFPDDNPESKFKPDDPDLLRNRPITDRLLVISAGIIANCIFAYSILFAQASTVGMASASVLPGVRIPKVVPGSAAEHAGVRRGDVIVGVGNQAVSNNKDNVNRLVQYIKDHPERTLQLKIARKEGVVDIPVMTELASDGDGKMGVQLATYAKLTRKAATGPADAAAKAAKEFVRLGGLVGGGLTQIFTNFSQTKEAVSGPLAIVAAGAEVARNDLASLYQFAAIVNINLAIVNALPLPALDGGYILLLLLEALRGKKLEKVVEQTFMASGFVLLTGLGVFLVIRDALNLGQNLL